MLRHILWAAIGTGAGYYVAKKHLEADYESRLRDEIEQTRKFYKNMYDEKLRRETVKVREQFDILKEAVAEVTDAQEEEVKAALEKVLAQAPDSVEVVDAVSPHPDIPEQADEPEVMPEEAATALVNYQGISAASPEPVGNITRILEQSAQEEELAYVKPDGPRIIDFNKYAENGGDYEQHTVVYYASDSEVSDESDAKLDKKYVGTHISYANLAKLNEENTTIYIRDDKHRKDHEVIWSAGSYDVDVLGNPPAK